MKKLDFNVPFSVFAGLGYLNCFAAVYTYLEHPHVPVVYKNGWDYHTDPRGMQEDWYFIFGTMSGYNSLLSGFEKTNPKPDANTEYCDFCMKFAGYKYKVVTEDFANEVAASVNAGYPVIARLKDNRNCRVLIGYDGDDIIATEPINAQGNNPPPALSDIEKLYIITEGGKPELTLIDGLRNIERSLMSVLENGIWDDLSKRFTYWDNLHDRAFEETKAVFCRTAELMMDFDHCHNFAEVFRHKAHHELWDDRFIEPCNNIDIAYNDSHDVQWAVQALHDCRDWNKRAWQSKEWGMCIFAQWGIERLKKNDIDVLSAVREMITMLDK